MKVGTKSLLFGVHQFLIHPVVVSIAWFHLYGRPTWRELACIVIHDWGYWGKPNMDGEEGENHPEFGAYIAARLLDGPTWSELYCYKLCLFHSRHYARKFGATPSKLCWADKLSIRYEPWWLYLPRAWASGELAEYRQLAAGGKMATDTCYVPLTATHRRWYMWVQDRFKTLGEEQSGDAVPYMNPARPKIKRDPTQEGV